ncbi:MAG: hypothetical protein C4527_15180 [Candidatus Omnitrophota bacterium]|jgi:general secretion pathway protein D|nr:MAG: hypothetical protein C4527_15180 [Candidatus Omnitrophota bacterium]
MKIQMFLKSVGCIVIAALCCFSSPALHAQNPGNDNGQTIRLNFRGVPLQTVLDYLSEAAGFIIVMDTNVDGRVDVWSHQPLSKEEAVNLLNTILHEKGYAAIRNERTLTIVRRDDARLRDLPVKTGNDPNRIPKTDEMVTQIIPVRYTNAVQLINNLQPLLPTYATMSANESSNAIVLVDTQKNIRRMTEIIRALDTSISSIASIRVFRLQYSDASELAQVITQLFQTDSNSNARNQRGGFAGRFPGFGDRGGQQRPGGNQEEESDALKAASRVVAVADEQTNSLIVTASEELMPTIEILVKEVDISVEDVTEIRVFHLQYADATEMAELITELFPDQSTATSNQFAPQFGGRGGFMGGPGGMGGTTRANTQQQTSDWKLQQTTVRAIADPRTDSLVVFAASETMSQIAAMIQMLDANPAKKQKVYVYKLEYADVQNVEQILRGIFENQTSASTARTTTNQNTSTLGNRTMTNTSTQTQSFRPGQ